MFATSSTSSTSTSFTTTPTTSKTTTTTSPSTTTTTTASSATTTASPTTTTTATATSTGGAPGGTVEVFLRVEGADFTIFQGFIAAVPQVVTTPSGGSHMCDGTNNAANPTPGGTPTDALASAAAAANAFLFDGTFDPTFDDFFITSIGGVASTATEFWGILADYQFTPVGGCQFEAKQGQELLWAFNAFNAVHFLKVLVDNAPGPATVGAGMPVSVTVVDGSTGAPVPNASVGGQTTDANGQVTLTFPKVGSYTVQATRSDSIRSAIVTINVD